MTEYEEFKCARLNRTMTAGKCLRLQKEAEDFFGADKAGKCTTCPCPQGDRIREELMRKKKGKRICRNCGRMMAIAQDNLCGGCFTRTKGLTGEKLAEEMEKAARDFGGVPEGQRAPQRKYYRGPQVKPQAAPESEYEQPKEVVEAKPGQGEKPTASLPSYDLRLPISCTRVGDPSNKIFPIIILPFDGGDRPIYDAVVKLALRYRRDPYQQILWLLEKELHNEKLLDEDPNRRYQLDAEATVTIAARDAGDAG